MRLPGVVGSTLDHHVARPQSGFTVLQDEGRVSLQQADDIDRMSLVHARVAGLIDDVMRAVEFGEPFSHCSVKLGLGYAVRQGIDHKPTHLEVAFAWSENRASGPEIFVNAWCKRP